MENAQRKREILDVCLATFIRRGLYETSVRDLSRALALQSGGIYYWFKDKDDVVVTCAEEAALRLEEHLIAPALQDIREPDRMMERLRLRSDELRPMMKFFASVCACSRYEERLRPVLGRLAERYEKYAARFASELHCELQEIAPYVYFAITTVTDYMIFGEVSYTFAIACTDQAGNPNEPVYYADGTVAPTAFTIDKTRPTISVTYDNNSALNGNYYNANRTATVVVTEHNFDASRVNITLRATDDGADIALPTVSGWTSSGDRHTATIAYRRDGLYTFDIDVTDKAGNTSADFTEQTFYVDTTAPTLEITGVADRSANNGDIIPVVSYSDTNYDDAQVNITLTGAMRKGVALDGSYADQHNGKVFTFKNFAKEKEVDDIYTLAATLTDKAGNTTEKTILFSANRFGSTYALSAATDQLNGSYVQTPQDVVVTETNPDALQNIRITLFKNNQTIILQEGTDYRIEVRGGNGQWYEYIYTVLAKNFADDGVYRLTFYSEDAAGNIAENTLDTKKQEIGFGVDKTKPNMVVTNLESDTTYPLENLTVSLSAGDNLLLQSVVVYLDDYSKAYKTWTAEEVAAIVADQGEFTFDIPGDSTGAHQVKIVCTDAAGNEQTEEITNFYVTTNLFVRYYNNKPLFFGSIAAVVVIAGVVIALAAGKKKKNDKEK